MKKINIIIMSLIKELIFDNLHDQYIIKNIAQKRNFNEFVFNISENGIKRLINFNEYTNILEFNKKLIEIIIKYNIYFDDYLKTLNFNHIKSSKYILNELKSYYDDNTIKTILNIALKHNNEKNIIKILNKYIEYLDNVKIYCEKISMGFWFLLNETFDIKQKYIYISFKYIEIQYILYDNDNEYLKFEKKRYKRGLKKTIFNKLPIEIFNHILSFL